MFRVPENNRLPHLHTIPDEVPTLRRYITTCNAPRPVILALWLVYTTSEVDAHNTARVHV